MVITKQKTATAIVLGAALLHILILGLVHHPLLPSNLVQFGASSFAVVLCWMKARRATVRYFRRLWYELVLAFLIWTAGQLYYVVYLLSHKSPPAFPNLSDFFCLLYSLPMLLVASRAQDQAKKNWTSILDLIQACIAVCSVLAILLTVSINNVDFIVYGIQGVALLFACTIRYSTATTAEERVFFRNLTIYVLSFDGLGLIARTAQNYGWTDGSATDLAWSLPFLIFFLAVIRLPERLPWFSWEGVSHSILPAHLHGLSSLGLALTSMTSGVLLAFQSARSGIPLLVISAIIFTLRTTIRELQLTQAHIQLEHNNRHDDLTGLGNRALLINELEKSSAPTSGKELLFIDLDRFKLINDRLGHLCGDRLLIHVANVLRSNTRQEDTVVRLSGDEFIVLFCGEQNGVTAEMIAERILQSLRAPVLIDGQLIHITASIGIVAIRPGEASTHLLRNADTAMYIAKSLGKNCIHRLNPSVLERTIGGIKIEADLRRSMEESEIVVGYQPIYSLPSKTLVGFEALARWTHPRRGIISPSEFIPLAEETGLIVGLGRQVLRMACFQTALWNKSLQTNLSVSVNVSVKQLADSDFLSYIKEVLEEAQLAPALLKLEITESVLLHDRLSAQEVLSAVQDEGIEICLDDFGTGYSSLSYLLEFPFDTIKIDRTFFRDIDSNPRRAEMLRTIAQLAKNLHKRVIAEGIETVAQLEFLSAIPCDFVQGFLFSKPLMPEVMTEILQSEMAESRL